jgi:ATP-binding cassette subfamily C protein
MARGEQTRSEEMLEAAVEDVLRVASGWFWLVVVLGLVGTALAAMMLVNRLLIFTVVAVSLDPRSLISTLVFMLLVTIAAIGLASIQKLSVARIANYMARRLAVPAVLASAQRAGRPETLATTAIADIEAIRLALTGPGAAAVMAAAVTPPLLILAFIMHWSFGLIALIFCAIAAVFSILITRATREAARIGGAGQARATGLGADAIRSGEAVLAMGMLPRLAGQWIEVSTTAAGEAWMASRRAARLRSVLDFFFGSYRGVFVVLSALLAASGVMTTHLAIGAVFVVIAIPQPFQAVGDYAVEIAAGFAAWQRLKGGIGSSPMPPDGLAFPCTEGRLHLERMSFGFRGPNPPLFRGVDLTIEPGEIVAIIGPSGSGKSTLLRLLIGMIRPNSGGVYLDGCSVGQWDRRDLARHLGFLPQDALLSRGTAAEVISRLDVPDMTLVLDAARRAGAHETIVGLELGYATVITGQHQLSMGQRHRIAIARALYGRPRIVVMDELAASLDTAGEAEIARLLAVLREEGTAVIFTTHRPGLLAVADRVLAIRNGLLVGSGPDADPQRLEAPKQRPARLAALTASPRSES